MVKLKCIDPNPNLTRGKIYTLLEESEEYYTVIDDDGRRGQFYRGRFVVESPNLSCLEVTW